MSWRSDFQIAAQPDGSSCGPTSLQAVYGYHGDDVPIAEIASSLQELDDGGVLGVQLACDALQRGYDVEINTYTLQMFDPTWFGPGRTDLRGKLIEQASVKKKRKLQFATDAYLRYLDLGGRVEMRDLSAKYLASLIAKAPVLTGLSSTWLYGGPREVGRDPQDDDVRGVPQGHFVVLVDWHEASRHVLVADPLRPNPFSSEPLYAVDVDRLIAAILLGIVTYDANLILIRPQAEASR